MSTYHLLQLYHSVSSIGKQSTRHKNLFPIPEEMSSLQNGPQKYISDFDPFYLDTNL